MDTNQVNPGDKKYFSMADKLIPVKIIQDTKYGVLCEFLEDSLPVCAGEKMYCPRSRLVNKETKKENQ